MNEVINWIKEHYQDVLAIIGGIVSVASIVVKLTPSQKDDAVLAKIIALLDHFSIFNPNGTETKKVDNK